MTRPDPTRHADPATPPLNRGRVARAALAVGSWAGRAIGPLMLAAFIVAAGLVALDTAAYAADAAAVPVAAKSIEEVVNNLRNWLVGILAAVATFFLTYGGVRYICAGGNPAEVEKAKSALMSAGIGYGLALLAPLIVAVIKDVLQ
jgi:hypothetical protein